MSIEQARQSAAEVELDLLLVSSETDPPVCKVVDFGRYKYKQRKKERLAKKGSKAQVIKELKMSPKISDNDYQVRVNLGRKFLTKGYNIKLLIFFKGREIAHQGLGQVILERYLEDVKDLGAPIGEMDKGQRNLYIMISPGQAKEKKNEKKQDQD